MLFLKREFLICLNVTMYNIISNMVIIVLFWKKVQSWKLLPSHFISIFLEKTYLSYTIPQNRTFLISKRYDFFGMVRFSPPSHLFQRFHAMRTICMDKYSLNAVHNVNTPRYFENIFSTKNVLLVMSAALSKMLVPMIRSLRFFFFFKHFVCKL